jgi:hypothetical protein
MVSEAMSAGEAVTAVPSRRGNDGCHYTTSRRS